MLPRPYANRETAFAHTVTVAVAANRFGGVFAEIGSMLVAALRRAGCEATLVDGRGGAEPSIDRLLLLGAGVEFDEVIARVRAARSDVEVVLWAFDPVPPPDITDTELSNGLTLGRRLNRMRRMERGVGGPTGSAGRYGRLKRGVRAAGLRLASGGRATAPETAFAFERLVWVLDALGTGRVDRVFASSLASVRMLERCGLAATYLPMPFDPALGVDHGGTRDLDVVFLGSTLDQRAGRVARISSALEGRGLTLTVVDAGCYGDDRVALLNRARISLNLHKFPWHLERIRLQLSMACGAAVVSELPLADPAPFEQGRHLEAASFDDLASVIVDLLADEPRRRSLVEEAAALIHRGPTMDSFATMLLAG
jgi:hypothetical protein